MAYVFFRRTLTPTPDSTLAPYVALNEYWDDEARTIYRDQETSAVNDPDEVAVNTELARYQVRNGVARVVRYQGLGNVFTEDEGVTSGPGGVCTLLAPGIVPNPATTSLGALPDASVTVTASAGTPPYRVDVRFQNQPTVLRTAVSNSTAQPAQFNGLGPARYQATLTDAAGCVRTGLFDVFEGGGAAYGPTLRYTYSFANGVYRVFWNPVTKAVENESFPPDPNADPNNPDYDDYTPAGQAVDGYLLADGYTWRVVSSDGNAGVYFTDSDTRKPGLLELSNLIVFHPDRASDATGGALVECTATDYPLSFQLSDGTGAAVGPPNSTGHFDGLTADSYEVAVSDSEGRTLTVPFVLRARYGKRWQLAADNLDGAPWSVEIWQLGYTGAVEAICGEGDAPVTLRSDGLGSAIGGQGDLPAAIGRSCELRLRATVSQLEAVQLGMDRDFRVDVYRGGVLDFRGYVTPDIYSADLQDGLVPVGITATDGLATLKETIFTGHVGQALTGRWPVLNTLLHCLSRCDVALPVRIATNRRPAELATVNPPEQYILTERAGYADLSKREPLDMRQVVEGIAQLLGGTLVQRLGRWEIRSALEAAGFVTQTRLYKTAGTPNGTPTIGAPAGLIKPPTQVRTAGAGWLWHENSQLLQIRAGWKSLVAATDVGFAANALPAGEAFNNDAAWNLSLDALLPTAGWAPAAGTDFPLQLTRAGAKNTDLGTRWPRTTGNGDTRYLQSGQLPNRPEPEGVPWALKVVGRLVLPVPANGIPLPLPGSGFDAAVLALEVVVDGQRPLAPARATFLLTNSDTDTTLMLPLGAIASQGRIVRLRAYPWDGTAPATAVLLIKQIAVVLQPQGATWDGADNFRADSNRGTVRPTEPVSVFHADVPLKAGLFEANAAAFLRSTSVVGGALTTTWARPSDMAFAPLLESAAYDGLALRAAPSRLLTGVVRYDHSAPLQLLDAADAPYDLSGRRLMVATISDNLKAARATVSLIEIGVGTALETLDPLAGYPQGVRLIDGVLFPVGLPTTPGLGIPRVRATHHGVRTASDT